ncbi:hypothetical protein D3C80_1121040 [compost metagenome]
MGAEGFVEVFNRRQCAHGIHMTAELADVQVVLVVILVFNFADNQFQNVFDSDQARHAAEFVNDNRHVITLGAELLQHPVYSLAFRHHHGGAQHLVDAEFLGFRAHKRQQILGHQNAFDVIFIFADHREARVGGFDNHVQALFQRLVTLERHHLGARDHDVAHALLGDIHHAFQHVSGIGIDQVVLLGITDQLYQIATVFGFAVEQLVKDKSKEPLLGTGAVIAL